ncbi:S26 family signal peptidase [Halobellus sp. GM3]|uniref:S26 family signal peptidase n=1 Tax=Halobellus sp. GM3 TaxID=3458410 RepID=UPI00403DD07D
MTDEEGDAGAPGRREEATTPNDRDERDERGYNAERDHRDAGRADADAGHGDTDPTDGPSDDDAADPEIPAGVAASRRSKRRPRPEPRSRAAGSNAGLITRFRTAQSGPLLYIRETLYSALAVVAVGLLLFAISGVWPPMVAVESGSMEPEMQRGDLIFVTEEHRFTPDYAYGDTGIVTVEIGTEEGYRSFGGNGSVVIYDPPTRVGSPIIHRAHFHVEEGENWYDRANPSHVRANSCEQLPNCPAPHDGFITKGDANAQYDQASDLAGPVRPEWIRGSARVRVPYLGHVRLQLAGLLAA